MDIVLISVFSTLIILLALAVPIGVSLGIAALVGMYMGNMDFTMFIQRLYSTFDSFPLLAVPFFVLAGDIMQQGTIAGSLLNFCRALTGHLTGALSHVSVLTCLFYGALSGSAPATTAAVGGIMIPAMEKENYPKSYATALNAAGGCLGVLIPPSVPLILYGSSVGCSISDLFLAGIIPGLVVGSIFMVLCYVTAKKQKYGIVHPKTSIKERFRALWEARWALMVPVIVLGGIYGGIVTPTEAGALAVVYALFVECFITKSMTPTLLRSILFTSLKTTGTIFFVVASANALSIVLVYFNAHEMLCNLITAISSTKVGIILTLAVVFMVLGTFVEVSIVILVLSPMLMPLLDIIQMNQVQFGLFMLVILATGFLTPPVGLNLFVAAGLSDLPVSIIAARCIPYCIIMLVVGLAIGFIPQMTLFLL